MRSDIMSINPKSAVWCALPVLVLALFSIYCVYWSEQAYELFKPLLFAVVDAASFVLLAIAELSIWALLSQALSVAWVFIAEYVFGTFYKYAFEVFIPVFISYLLVACLLNRTSVEDVLYTKYGKAFKILNIVWIAHIAVLLISAIPHLKEQSVSAWLIAILVISALMLIVMFYTDSKNNNILSNDM